MYQLIITKQIATTGVANDTPKISFVEHHFTTPTNIMVQAVITSCVFNRQQTGFWQVELTVDSWEAKEGNRNVIHTVPSASVFNAMEIKKCNWIKVRLTAVNGGGSGIMNIYT
jgi:hypothetical protein